MKDVAKVIVDYWKERNDIVAIEEINKIYIYRGGLYIPLTDAKRKYWINAYLDEPTEQEEKDQDFLDVKFTTALLHQVKNRLFSVLISLDVILRTMF